MSEEHSLFICRNENCNSINNYSGEALSGGMISEINVSGEEKSFQCKHCKTEHKIIDGELYLVPSGGELVIESSSDYDAFNSEFEANRVILSKLIIRNLKTSNFKANEINFNKCLIQELIVENVNIDSAYSPFTFSNCTIENVKVTKTLIREIKSNNYKSLWSFFGINFFNTSIPGEIICDKTETSISISKCEINKPIKLSGKSKLRIAVVHCQKIPAIKADKTSTVTHILETTGRDPSDKKKKISTNENNIRNFTIDELCVEPDTTEPALIENCHIKQLTIPEGKNIKGKLIFRNCVVDQVDNQANSFDQDLVFFGCRFEHQIMLTGSYFKRSLVFEFCSFQSGLVLNNIDIERDLQINHATVTGDISLEGNRCQGYVKSRFNEVSGAIRLEDNSIVRDLNIIHVITDQGLICKYNEIGGYVFIKQVVAKEGVDLNMLNADSLNIIDIATDKDLEMNTVNLKNDLKVNRLMLGGNLTITFSRIDGMINMSRSRILENFTAYFLDSRLNMFIGVDVHGGLNFNSCKFLLQTWTNRNLFRGNMFWNTLQTHNASFSNNRVLSEFSLETVDAKAITIDDNIVDASIELNNSHSGDIGINKNICGVSIQIKDSELSDIELNGNYAMKNLEITKVQAANVNVNDNRLNSSFSIDKSGIQDLKVYDNYIYEKLEIANSNTRDFLSGQNLIREEFMLNFLTTHDFRFNDNLVEKLNIFNSRFTEFYVKECLYIGDTNLNSIKVENGFRILDNVIEKELYMHQCLIGQKTEIEYNFANTISIQNSETHDIHLLGNNLLQEIKILDSKTNDVSLTNNQAHETLSFSSLESGVLRLEGNSVLKEVSLFNLNCGDLNLMSNDFREELKIEYPHVEDMLLRENKLGNITVSNGSIEEIKLGKSQGVGNCIFYGIAVSKDMFIFNIAGAELYIQSCQVGNNILFDENFFLQADLRNNRANDIILKKNVIDKFLEFTDIQSNNINISSNKISFAFSEERTSEEENKDPRSIVMRNCVIENNLDFDENVLPETVLIRQNLSDKLSFTDNRTKSLKLSMGRYRQLSIGNCKEIWDFSCNNVTVDRDISIYNNVFHEEFAMLYCKVENDLDFDGNVFKDIHRLFNNTINGTTNYKNEKLDLTMNIQQNKFNFFNMVKVVLEGTFYLINNTIDGGMIIGKVNDDHNSDPFQFLRAVSITENKIKTATFQYLEFHSSLCIRHNNFEGDLNFRNTTHLQTLDFTSCFIGGSFVFYNSSKQKNDGHLILDNAFIDKRITFTNYFPASFSYIKATFNGFEIPDDWCMRNKQLHTSRFDTDSNAWKRMLKKITRLYKRNTDSAILRENQLRSQSYKKAELPYSIMKGHYLEDEELKQIPEEWKKLKPDIFLNKELLEKLDQTHRREDKQTDGALLQKYFGLYDQCVTEDFIPIYYNQFSDFALDAIIDGASKFSTLENNYKDDDTKEAVETLKAFFVVFHKALLYFKNHSFHIKDAPPCQTRLRYKNILFKNLEEQYKVLRHIWGGNGELKEEDAAYYKWMHFKNISSMRQASYSRKPLYWMRYLLYEKVFGWGVDLFRIVFSTLLVVCVFAVIYNIMFHIYPDLSIHWDNNPMKGDQIGFWKSIAFAFQTTFSAGLGDWAPIGSGAIKIPMTINAVLGVLFVTFLIGAYGRKMLR